MTIATRKAPKPDFYPVGEPFESHGFPCKIERDRAGGPTPYPMTVDQQIIGYARTEADALVTIDTYCDELSRHTRATTADMAADAAEFRAELAERTGPEWSCTPENPCDGECAEHSINEELAEQGLRLADEDEAGYYVLVTGGEHVWATDEAPRWGNPITAPIFEAPIATQEQAEWAEGLTTGIRLNGETSFRTHSTAAERDEYLRYNPSAWVLVEPTEPVCPTCLRPIGQRIYDPVTGVCLDCQGQAAGEEHQNRPAPATPPRTVDELRAELDAVTDAILSRKITGTALINLKATRDQIIAELDAAHKTKDAELRTRILEIITPTSSCSSCGDPLSLCPARLDNGEVPATPEPIPAWMDDLAAKWRAEPAPQPEDPCADMRRERDALQARLEALSQRLNTPIAELVDVADVELERDRLKTACEEAFETLSQRWGYADAPYDPDMLHLIQVLRIALKR